MRVTCLLFAGALAATTLLSGMYAVAASAATSLAASISTQETARHTRSVEFSARANPAPAGYPPQVRKRKPNTMRETRS